MPLSILRDGPRILGLAAVAAAAGLPLPPAAVAGSGADSDAFAASAALREAMTAEGVRRHLLAFQAITEANGGTRAAGTPGYEHSAEYVADQLRAAGYEVRRQSFEFPLFEELSPPRLSWRHRGDNSEAAEVESAVDAGELRTLAYSGPGTVMAPLQPVALGLLADRPPGASTSGCDAADFDGFERGRIALIRRGSCPFQTKVDHAVAAGAAGVIIANEGTDGRTGPFSGQLMRPGSVPVVGVSYAAGEALDRLWRSGGHPLVVRLSVNARSVTGASHNVIAEALGGDVAKRGVIVVLGAHLDSVREGPGINDNGSGAAAVLEIAWQLARLEPALARRARFVFWGAEELGLVGSRQYVASLSDEERWRIAVYLNLDMVGSPNGGRFVYAPGATPSGAALAAGAPALGRVLLDYFEQAGLSVEQRGGNANTGSRENRGSDHHSFAAQGIPVAGLFTGAEGVKSAAEAEAARFGGRAGERYDPCYHRACDTLGNIDPRRLEEMAKAAAHAVLTWARDNTDWNSPRDGGGNSGAR